MMLRQLHRDFSVCKVHDISGIDLSRPYVFLSVTEQELSLVCEAERVPAAAFAVEPCWRGVMIAGVIDFDVIGILARVSKALADKGIALFAISTYNTDYLFVKSDAYTAALAALQEEGYTLCN